MLQGFTEKFNFGGEEVLTKINIYGIKYAWKGETWIDYRFKGGEECGKRDGGGGWYSNAHYVRKIFEKNFY